MTHHHLEHGSSGVAVQQSTRTTITTVRHGAGILDGLYRVHVVSGNMAGRMWRGGTGG